MTIKNTRYRELDALRGIAALVVVLFHFTMEREQAKLGFELGVTGVDLFFMISGFVIFMSINKVSSTLEFWINRFTRLFPVYWVCVTITFLIKLATPQLTTDLTEVSFIRYLGNLTMFQYYFFLEDIDGPYWTMLVEMLFYISIAVVFAAKKMKYILHIGISILLLSLLNELVVEFFIPQARGIYKVFPLLVHFPLFLAGIIFYKLMHLTQGDKQKVYLYAALALCFITKLLLVNNGGVSLGFISFNQYLFTLCCYFLLFILFVSNRLGFVVNPVSLYLGKISFPLYLIHHYISIRVIIPLLLKYTQLNFWLIAAIALVIVVGLAAAISYFIEFPYDRKLNTYLRSKVGLPKRGVK
jgi:peptidoglycan/LPS O-acetylase OafA/YrhL